MKAFWFLSLLLLVSQAKAQDTLRTLFVGNSYTYTNNLPDIISNIAFSMGDAFIYSSSTPGGYTFQMHSSNASTLGLLQQGNWDYVVLQEQSQLPSFPDSDVEVDVYPYAQFLDSLAQAYSPCSETVFYMTWGRQNGDASNCAGWPPVCTYEGMDSLLHARYRYMADSNQAILSPVGAVWHYIRTQWPAINLYNADASHPSPAGSYAAACTFYAVMYRKDPALSSYQYSLSSAEADSIKQAVHRVVFDSLWYWNVGKYDIQAGFGFATGANPFEVEFSDSSVFADQYSWNFGDGQTSNSVNPVHQYDSAGTYIVQLIVERCGKQDTASALLQITAPLALEKQAGMDIRIFPNPSSGLITIESPLLTTQNYQWTLVDGLGQTITQWQGNRNNSQQFDLSAYPAALYQLRLLDEQGKLVNSWNIRKN